MRKQQDRRISETVYSESSLKQEVCEMQNNDIHRYDDIINLPHHVSSKRPQMSLYDRAAQFSAFKALTGYEDYVTEAARLTGERIELDDASLSLLNGKIQI